MLFVIPVGTAKADVSGTSVQGARAMASSRGILNIQSLNELTSENCEFRLFYRYGAANNAAHHASLRQTVYAQRRAAA